MTIREFYIQRRKAETPLFLEVLRSLPEGHLDYRPADDSPSAKEIAWVMTRQLKSCNEIISEGQTEWKSHSRPRGTTCCRIRDVVAEIDRKRRADDR